MPGAAGPSTASSSSSARPTEQSPLLQRDVRTSKSQVTIQAPDESDEEEDAGRGHTGFIGKGREVEVYHPGKSTFWQTVSEN